jgi:hypothetical protein
LYLTKDITLVVFNFQKLLFKLGINCFIIIIIIIFILKIKNWSFVFFKNKKKIRIFLTILTETTYFKFFYLKKK